MDRLEGSARANAGCFDKGISLMRSGLNDSQITVNEKDLYTLEIAKAEYGAKSTMTAILGRMATYSGTMISWEEAINSNLSLADVDRYTSLADEAPVKPNDRGEYAIPVPGETKVL